MDTITAEERVRQIRAAFALGDRPSADHQFLALLQESGKSTERWLRRVIALTPAIQNASAYYVSADLRQELAMHLWQHITASEPAWECTYWQALVFAQRHVATRYMREAGYWVDVRSLRQGWRGMASLSVQYDSVGGVEGPDALAAAE